MIKISKFSNTVEYNLRTTLDASGITQLQSEISKTLRTLDELGNKKLLSQSQVTSATKDIQQLQSAFSKAFDSNIGMLNLKTFQKELSGLNVDSLRQSFANAGVQGTQLFNNMIGQIGKMDTNFKNLSSTTDKIFNTMGNTVRWGVTASIFQRIQNSIYGAVEYVQELDRSLNDIRIVSGQSADQMRDFSLYANEAAKSLGQTTTAFTDASLIFLQQGLDQNTSNQLADLTLRMANVTGQDTATASEQITSIMNGYNMTIQETEAAIDTLANVAAQGASDMEELATAESRVASTASTLGVSQEQLAAQISTMISVTRQAPETVGNSLRTLYSRLADLKMGDTLEDGVNLGQFSQAVEDVGVQVLDQTGNLRNMGDIIEDLMVKWQDLSSAQQISLGTTLAGRYQLNQFLTLMNNMEMYNEQLAIAEDSAGTLDEQQSIYMDSMAAKVNQLTAAGEGLVSTLFNPDDYKPALEVLTQLINGLTDLINITGGAGNAFLGLGSIITKTFSTQIGRGISNLIQNQQRQKLIRENPVNASAVLSFMGAANPGEDSAAYQFVDKNYSQQPYMSTEQVQQYNNLLEQTVEIENKLVEARKTAATTQSNLDKAASRYTNLTKLESSLDKETGLFKDDTAVESMKAVAQNYSEIATKVSNLRKELSKTSTVDYGDTLQRYTSRLQDFANECNYAKEDVEALALKIDDLANATRQDIADSGILQDLDKLETEATRRQQATTAVIEAEKRAKEAQMAQSYAQDMVDNQRRANDIFSEGMNLQQKYSSIVQITGAVGQLAFAWQSFQSLGSIFARTDLSDGEKLAQILEGLLFTLPALVSGFVDIREALQTLGFGNQVKEIKSAADAFNMVKSTGGSAFEALSAGAVALGTGVKGVAASLKALLLEIWPLLAIGAAIGAISGIIGAVQQSKENEIQGIKDAASSAAENLDSLKTAQSNFEQLYEGYQEGTVSSEELSAAAETLNGLIDNQSAKVQAAAGNWDAYAKSVANASQEQALANQSTMQANTWQAEKEFVEQPGFFGINRYHSTSRNWNNDILNEAWQNATSLSASGKIGGGTDWGFADDTSASQRIQDLENFDKAFQDAIGEANNVLDTISDTASQEYQEAQDNLNSLQNSYNEFIAFKGQYSDTISAVQEAYQEQADNLLAAHLNDADYQYMGGTVAEYTEQVKTALQADGVQASQQVIDAFVQGMMNADTESAQALAAQAGAEDAQQNLLDSYIKIGFSEADAQEAVQRIYDELEAAGASSEEILQIVATIDPKELLANLEDIIAAINNGDSLDEILLRYKVVEDESAGLGDSLDTSYDSSDISSMKEELSIDDDTYQGYTEAILNSEPGLRDLSEQIESTNRELSNQNRELRKNQRELSSQQSELEAGSDEYKNYQEQIDDLSKQIDDNNDVMEDSEDVLDSIVAKTIESAKGVEELDEVFDDAADTIRNASSESLDYTDAINSLVPGVEHLLNLDMSGWSQPLKDDFISKNLSDIEAAINGDVAALQRLRGEAAQAIIVNMHLDPAAQDSLLAQAQSLIAYANTILPDLQAGASIDDAFFYQQLNAMIASAYAAGASVSDILEMISALGVEAEIEYVTVPVNGTMPVPKVVAKNLSSQGGDTMVEQGLKTVNESYYGTAVVPQVKMSSLKYVGRGGSGSVGRYGGGGGGGRGGGGGGGRGGGGGGGGSSYTPKTKDTVENDIDRYEKVDTVLDSLANQFERIADEQERLTGAELAVNMAEQIDLLKQQVEWQKQKLEIQKQEAAEYKNILANEYGLTFNEEGFIQNYADKYTEMLNNLNALIAQYNATTTEAGQNALEEQITNAQESFDKFSELVNNYDELISNSILESENQIEEFYDKMEDLRIEAFQKSVEAVDNIKDLQEQLIDFEAVFSGMDSDDPFRDMMVATQKLQEYWQLTTGDMNSYYDQLIARNEELMATADEEEKQRLELQNQFYEGAKQNTLSNSNGLGTGYLDMEMNNLNKIMEQIQQYKETGTSEIFGENSAALYETARDIFESATEMILDYEDLLDDLKDAILDAIDELGDAIDRRLEQFENINDELEHYSSIIEMLYGEQAYDLLNQAASATIENSQNYINEIRQDIDVLKDLQSAMEEGSEQWNNLQDMIDEKQQDLLDMTESTLEQIVDMYQRSVNQILDKWISAGTGMDDLDWMSEQWELINRNADYYLDDVNAAYEIQKLQNKYLEMLNEADNLAIQNQITQQMQEQLEYLREKDKLSEYDVAYANAQLEILQKRIALEDAQRNKSQLQLRRDTQGNYSYVYTANEDDVFNAQNDLLDAQNNAYNLSKDQIKQTQDDSLSALQDAKDMLNQIWTDANLTLEEKTKRTQVIIDSLREYLAGTSEQLSTAEQNIINDFIGMCELLLDENKGNLDDIYDEIISGNTDAFDQIDDRWNTSITNWLYNMDEFDKATADMLENLTQNFEDYTERVEELGDIAGITFDDMTSHINDATDATNNLAQSTSDFINQLKQDSGVIKDYQSQLSAMTAKVQDAENAMKAYADQVRDLQNELVSKELENSNLSDQLGKLEDELENNRNDNNSSSSGGGGGGGSSAPAVDESLAWGIAQAIWTYGGASGWGNNPTRSTKLTSSYGTDFAKRVQQIINQHSASGSLVNYDSMKYSSYQLIGYDTGGYTGDWGTNEGNLMANNGKLAWLHQKELVLNQSDTSNILAAVQAVRSMTENFRNGAFEDLVSTLSNYGSDLIAKPAVDMAANGTTEFNVECVFPNATNVEQIQQAILGLPEQVSQFTYRK